MSFKKFWPYLRTLLFFYVGIKGLTNFLYQNEQKWLHGGIGALFIIVATFDILQIIRERKKHTTENNSKNPSRQK